MIASTVSFHVRINSFPDKDAHLCLPLKEKLNRPWPADSSRKDDLSSLLPEINQTVHSLDFIINISHFKGIFAAGQKKRNCTLSSCYLSFTCITFCVSRLFALHSSYSPSSSFCLSFSCCLSSSSCHSYSIYMSSSSSQ